MKIHLDTDIGGDMDDLCALAMLLKWPELEITGITTVSDDAGRRAGYVQYLLELTGRTTIPVAAGADVSPGCYRVLPGYPPDEENWPEPIAPLPGTLDDALSLLKHSIDQGATIVGIGPYTNLALLDKKYPGILEAASLFLVGGRIFDPRPGYPQWDNEADWNIQLDVQSAQHVLEHSSPTLITLAMTCETALRRADLPKLAQAGRLGEIIVRQAEVCAKYEQHELHYGQIYPGLPNDMINFQHDSLGCAIASGWRTGVEIETVSLKFEMHAGWLHEIPNPAGRPTRIVTRIDSNAFNKDWCDIICA